MGTAAAIGPVLVHVRAWLRLALLAVSAQALVLVPVLVPVLAQVQGQGVV